MVLQVRTLVALGEGLVSVPSPHSCPFLQSQGIQHPLLTVSTRHIHGVQLSKVRATKVFMMLIMDFFCCSVFSF